MKYIVSLLLSGILFLGSQHGIAEEKNENVDIVKNPFDVLPFELPKADSDLYKNYRKNWSRLTGFEYSGLHWKQFVAIFANKGADIYRENYLAYLALYRDDDDDEDEDEEDSEDESIDSFREYEIGTIFLKENYQADKGKPGKPSSLTMMIKRPAGFDPNGGNWEYLQTDVKGGVIMQGDSNNQLIQSSCSNCHANMAERDYIFSTFLTTKFGH